MLIRSYKFRIYPTKRQETLLNQTLEECRWLYNHLLEQRIKSWKEDKVSLTYYDQSKYLTQLKVPRESLNLVYSQTLQDVAMRLDLAFKAFFRRLKSKDKPGYPRFKGKGRYDSITFPQYDYGCKIKDGKLAVSKIGYIKIKLTRKLGEELKLSTIKKSPTNKWYVIFIQEVQSKLLPKTGLTVGIDVGIKTFAHLSDDLIIDNPKFFKESEKKLAKIQRKLSKAKKGTKNRAKCRKVVAKVYEKIMNKRTNFAHQMSRQIVDTYDLICIEDLNINQMKENNFKCMNKNISDVAWKQFFNFVSYKAEWAGKEVIKVNPAYTSQDCSRCGYRQKLTLSDRVYSCPCCGLELDRDHNAAINILRLGTQSLDKNPRRPLVT